MVVITAGGISDYAKLTLRNDGWIVQEVEAVQNPSMRDDGQYPARFWAVYTKLNVFNMVEYDKGALKFRSPFGRVR
jgi:alpha-N-acetylglucosamine transferase